MSEKQEGVNQLYAKAMIFIPNVLPGKLTLAGIDDLFVQLGAEKDWLEKGHPRLWESGKQQRVREWFSGITKFRPALTFPIALNVLNVIADTNPALPAKERRIAIELAREIASLLGLAAPPPPVHSADQRIIAVA